MFVVKYDAVNGQKSLERHVDGGDVSFMLALSPRSAFTGGGTTFDVLASGSSSAPLHLDQGQICTFHADLYHTGNPILEGLRYLLVGFCYCESGGGSDGGGGRSGNPGTVGLDLQLIAEPPPSARPQQHTAQRARREPPFTCHSFPSSFPGFDSGECGGSGGGPSLALLEAVRALAAMESSKFVRVDGGGGANLLEALALEIYRYHADRLGAMLGGDGSDAVVEYWGQHLLDGAEGGGGDAIPLHFDKDEDLYRKTSQVANPLLSTVTYLTGDTSNGRALPTIVFDPTMSTHPSDYNLRNQGRTATQAHSFGVGGGVASSGDADAVLALVSYPKPGKHLSFDGALLHGVPSELKMSAAAGGCSGKPERITFMVNIWLNRQPKSSKLAQQTESVAPMAGVVLPLKLPAGLAAELSTYPERAMPFIDIPEMKRGVENGEDSFLLTLGN